MKKKLIIGLISILAVAVVFAACKNNEKVEESSTDPSTTESTTLGEAYTDEDGFCVDEPVEDKNNNTNKDNANNNNNSNNSGENNGGNSIIITPGDPDGPGFVDDGDPIIFGDGNGGQEDSIGWDEIG